MNNSFGTTPYSGSLVSPTKQVPGVHTVGLLCLHSGSLLSTQYLKGDAETDVPTQWVL